MVKKKAKKKTVKKKTEKPIWDKKMNILCLVTVLTFLIFIFVSWTAEAYGAMNLVISLLAVLIVALICCRLHCKSK